MTGSVLPGVIENATELALQSAQRLFTQGQTPENYLVVTEGCVKVYARSREGKEVVLYRVHAGEMCILTTACLLGHTRYPAEAMTESDTRARVIPAHLFESLLHESDSFRQFVFEGLSMRLAQVMERFEHLVLESVHRRLADFLLRHANPQGMVETTHELLAMEIGTVREVVSRHLSSMEKDGLVATQRGQIKILRPLALARLE
jgi:CRP/FNR family transcriptional regulator